MVGMEIAIISRSRARLSASARFLAVLTIGLLLVPVARGQVFALVSPQIIRSLPAKRNLPAAKEVVRAADAALDLVPHAMVRVHTEGTLYHQGIRDQSEEAEKDWYAMRSLALAYRITGEKRYFVQAARLLDAWVTTYKISGNPIDETNLDSFAVTFDLIHANLRNDAEQRARTLFRTMATTYLDWLDANFASDPYNWSSHRVKLAVLGAYISGDRDLIDRAAHAYARHVKQNIRPDGSVDDFYKRDAMHYVVYDLEPLAVAALAARAHGQDWFHTSATGSPSVQMGVDWLLPYALGQKTHEEFVHSTVKFDADRAAAGEHGYSGMWERKTSVGVLTLAAALDSKYASARDQVASDTGTKPLDWVVLIAPDR